MNVSSFLYHVRSVAERSRRYSQRHFKLLGALVVVVIPLTTYVERAVASPSFDTLYVRVLAGLAGLPLLVHDRLPLSLKKNMELIWVAVLTYVLPFSYGLILTLNAAFTESHANLSSIWIYQYLVALFIFIQLTNHGPLSVLLWLVSTGLVLLIATCFDEVNAAALQEAWLYPMPVYVTALVIGSLTNRNVHIVQSEQLRAASAIGSNIAHELRTPLASIRSLARGIGRFLPALVGGYEEARKQNPQLDPISPDQLRELRKGLESIQAEVEYSNTIINMLLLNTSEGPISSEGAKEFRISQAMEEAVSRFPFNNSDERQLIAYYVEADFHVLAPRALIVHVFFNLIKNGLFFVQRSGRGKLTLNASQIQGRNVVEVTDTGTGIAPNLVPRIFDRFFSASRSNQGAGIGLSFCKMVMDSIGGTIECDSREGEYTTFRLTFPSP